MFWSRRAGPVHTGSPSDRGTQPQKGGESIEVEVRPILRKLYDAVVSGLGPQQPAPDRRRARSVVGDGEPHSPELADELAVGRVKASAELLRGDGGEPVR